VTVPGPALTLSLPLSLQLSLTLSLYLSLSLSLVLRNARGGASATVIPMRTIPECFHPLIRTWFADEVGPPTAIQSLAWPRIATGDHVLVTAPTGSGKTLAAFLWALDQLLTGAWESGGTRVLYITPVKALGTDISRNLRAPLDRLSAIGRDQGWTVPAIGIRSGDTPQADRRRMLKHPPEILITTPESLNLLLTSPNGRRMLGALETVILDEIHAVVDSKRGIHLITAVERLAAVTGEFQRIGLSATINPLDRVARWMGGRELVAPGTHRERPVIVLESPDTKPMDVAVGSSLHDGAAVPRDREAFWECLATDLRRDIAHHHSTLVFANSRRMVERVARLVNEGAGDHLAWSHHGALSREIRHLVEQRLKAGALRAIVATNSLELGIDVGAVDQVVLVQAPPTVASAVQRIGRSGHQVGATSRGRFYPLHPRDLLQCAVAAEAALAGDLEPVHPMGAALDVLAQVLLSMTVGRTWRLDALYDGIRCADPYRSLPRRHFDLVVDLLAGRYASTRQRSLDPLVSVDRVDGTISARSGAERRLYLSGGTIPDRGYYKLKMHGTNAPLGELDEEFVWERSVGDTFSLGVQAWRVEAVTHSEVLVSPAPAGSAMAPFWRADERDGSHHLAQRVARWMHRLEADLITEDLKERLTRETPLTDTAATQLVEFLAEQLSAAGCLPHRHRVLVEHSDTSRGRSGDRQIFLHTLWGGRVNRALGLALKAAWHRDHDARISVLHDEDCVLLSVPADTVEHNPLARVQPDRLDELVRDTLAATGYFGARFREAAGIALTLPRSGPNRRTPLWLHRQRAKDLLENLRDADDFPLVLEAWRSCLEDGLDLSSLRDRLLEVADGDIEVTVIRTEQPSPLAAHVLWRQTNDLMYDDDRPAGAASGRIRDDLLSDLVLTSDVRHLIARDLVTELDAKLQRLAEGYAPPPGRPLVDWLVERTVITLEEWQALVDAVARDHGEDRNAVVASVTARVVRFADRPLVTAVETVHRLADALGVPDPAVVDFDERPVQIADVVHSDPPLTPPEILRDRLRYLGPAAPEDLAHDLGWSTDLVHRAAELLVETGDIAVEMFTEDARGPELCDRENLERLLRMTRRQARPAFVPRPAGELGLFLADLHGLGDLDASHGRFEETVENLFGWPAPAALWESDLLPARSAAYHPRWIDGLLRDTTLQWVGCGEGVITLIPDADRLLLAGPDRGHEDDDTDDLFPHRLGRFTTADLALQHETTVGEVSDRLWAAAWEGRVTADTFAPVRHGAANGFRVESIVPPTPRPPRSSRRLRLERWQATRETSASWFPLSPVTAMDDPLEQENLDRERVRLLLERHGILFRTLLERELPSLRWSAVFRALRLMELSGEILGGRFFDGVPGLQFMAPEAFRRLRRGLPEDRIFWLCAADPASICSLGLEGLEIDLPDRRAGNHLVFHGPRTVLVSEATGRRLRILVPPDHPAMDEYLVVLRHLLGRAVNPRRSLTVETINGEPAPGTDYAGALSRLFHTTRTHAALRLSRRV
jgi:ATP-dependent Lhr-like helicase